MDYKKFLSVHNSVIADKEAFGREKLELFKKEDRSYDYFKTTIGNLFLNELKELEKKSKFDLRTYSSIWDQKKEIYTTNSARNILENEIKEVFMLEPKTLSFSNLLTDLATRIALRNACLGHKFNAGFNRYLYIYNDFEKFTLEIHTDGIETTFAYKKYEKKSKFRIPEIGITPTNWDRDNFEELLREADEKNDQELKQEEKVQVQPEPGEILIEDEKLFILHLLKQFAKKGSEIKTTEFLRIIHLTSSAIPSVTDLSGSLPNYRKINDGWIHFPKNERIDRIENLIAKLNKFQLPILKNTLNQKLKSEQRKR